MDKKKLRKKIEKKLRKEIERELRAKIRREFGATTLEESQESEEEKEREVTSDSYIRKQMGNIEIAQSFFSNYLPEEITERTLWDSLRLAPADFVRKALGNRRSDILYEVTFKGGWKGFFYLHFEHQSTSPQDMPYRNLIYLDCIWEQYRVQHPGEKPPLIYSMVLFQGPGNWTAPTTLHDYLDVPDFLKGHVPQFAYDLIDLTSYSDEQIRKVGYAGLKVALLALKYVRSPDIIRVLADQIFPLIQSLEEEKSGLEYLEDLLYYLSRKSPHFDEDVVIQELQKLPESKPMQEVAMTVAEKLEKRGREKGKEEGKEEGKKEGKKEGKELIALNLLNDASFSYEQVSKFTELPLAQVMALAEKGTDGGQEKSA